MSQAMPSTYENEIDDTGADLELDGTVRGLADTESIVPTARADPRAATITAPQPAQPRVSLGHADPDVPTILPAPPFPTDSLDDAFAVASEPVFTAADFVPKIELTSGDLMPIGPDLGPPGFDTLERMNLSLETTGETSIRPPVDEPRNRMGRAVLVAGTAVGDRYSIEDLLGQGGMADVYRAVDSERGHEVALKLLDPVRGIGTARARFLQEMQLCRQLVHPALPVVYDFGEWNGRLYLSMELLLGESVRDLLQRLDGASADLALTAAVGRGVSQALQVSHRAGVIHRDVKPANVFVVDGGGVKLLDFGVAKPLLDDPGLSATGTVPGTPAYLAPEILLGRPPAPTSDLWSLGVLLYEMATGRRPFPSDHLPTLIRTIRHVDPMPPTRHNPRVPPGLERLILRLLTKEPKKRPQDAASLELLLAAL
jgi:hypothetical protein